MDRRQVRLLRTLLNAAILSLLVGAALNLLETVFGTLYSVVLGLGTVLVTGYCFYKADQQANASREYYLWRYIPTTVFIVVPILLYVLSILDKSWSLEALYLLINVSANYLLPIACLLYVERSLKRYTF